MHDHSGRPTKYKPEYCQMLVEHMAKGLSLEAFAGVVKVNQDTVHEWVKAHPEFSEAKKDGLAASLLFWENIGIEGIWNTREKMLNTGNYVFQMKNRFKWNDRIVVEGGEESKPLVLKYKV
jgi:hypothetical protein